jgi:hypothetical protein
MTNKNNINDYIDNQYNLIKMYQIIYLFLILLFMDGEVFGILYICKYDWDM